MPLNYTTPPSEEFKLTETRSVKSLKIVKEIFVIEEGQEAIKIIYKKGFDSTSGKVEYSDELFEVVLGPEETIQYFADNPTIYSTVKNASYDLLKARLSIEGSIE